MPYVRGVLLFSPHSLSSASFSVSFTTVRDVQSVTMAGSIGDHLINQRLEGEVSLDEICSPSSKRKQLTLPKLKPLEMHTAAPPCAQALLCLP